MSEREQWVPAFQKEFGLTWDEVMGLSDTEFCNQRDYLELEGIKPGPQPKTDEAAMEKMMITVLKKKAQIRRQQMNAQRQQQPRQMTQAERDLINEHRRLQEEQNAEYEEVLRIAREKELEKAESDPRKAILEKAAALAPEPENGITLAVVFPSQKRLSRKFAKDTKGEDVVIWTAAQDDLLEYGSNPIEFELRQPGGAAIIQDKTLDEQGITGRTLFNVVLSK